MFSVKKSIDLDFAHHVGGHNGACINIHGHTWKFEVEVGAEELDATGFVVDFKKLKTEVLEPVHLLLDHSLALHADTMDEIKDSLITIGGVLVSTRKNTTAESNPGLGYKFLQGSLCGAENKILGGMKCVTFPFSPTSERIAKWLWGVADHSLTDGRVFIIAARVYETLHPVEAVAEYCP